MTAELVLEHFIRSGYLERVDLERFISHLTK
jgi:hypothetical protein